MRIKDSLVGDRIRIRNYEVADKTFCTGMWFDRENGKYLSDPTEEYVDDVYQEAIDTLQDSEDGYYFVVDRIADDQSIGTCCAFPSEDGTNIDIGYCILKEYWRQGYASEVLELLISWAKGNMFGSITAEAAKENVASCGLLEKMGFTIKEETTFKKYRMGITYDSYVYELRL